MRLGRLLLWLGFFWLASSHLWSQSSGSAQEAFGRGTALYRAGDFDGAIREYRAALALDPANFETRSNLGVALTRIGHYEEAIAVYRQALENAPPAAATHLRMNLALAYYKSGQISEAATLFDEVRKQLPDDLQVTLLSADCYLRLGNLDRVIGLLSPLASAGPGDPAVNYMLGMALIRSGNIKKGQEFVDSILRDSESAEAHFVLGSVAFMAKDYPGAVKEFSKAISYQPRFAVASVLLRPGSAVHGRSGRCHNRFPQAARFRSQRLRFEPGARPNPVPAARCMRRLVRFTSVRFACVRVRRRPLTAWPH